MKKSKTIYKIFLIVSTFLFIIYVVYKNIKRKEYLNENVKYTEGRITEFKLGANVNPWFNYIFYANNENHKGKYNIIEAMDRKNIEYYSQFVGKYFYVKYNINKPEYNEMDINMEVPDSIIKRIKLPR